MQKLFKSQTFKLFLAGVMFTLGFEPFSWWIISIISLGYLIHTVRVSIINYEFINTAKINKKKLQLPYVFWQGWYFSMGTYLTSLYWLYSPMQVELQSYWLSIPAGIVATFSLSLYLAIYTGLVAVLVSKLPLFIIKNSYFYALAWSLLWVGGELIRGWAFTGFPWNLIGYIWSDNLYLLQTAYYGKVWLLSFWIVLISGLLSGYFLVNSIARNSKVIAIALFILTSLYGYGCWRTNYMDNNFMQQQASVNKPSLLIRIVQPNIKQSEKWGKEYKYKNLSHILDLAMDKSVSKPVPKLIILPETAITFLLENSAGLLEGIRHQLPLGTSLITGIPSLALVDDIAYNSENTVSSQILGYHNSLIAINSVNKTTNKSDIVSVNFSALEEGTDLYHKQLLVPFGEYIPFRQFIPSFVGKLVSGQYDYISGQGNPKLSLHDKELNILPLICFEGIFPYYVNKNAFNKDFILIATNDAWFDGTLAQYQHYAMSKVRAVETGLPVVRVANSGISAVVDGLGREKYRIKMRQSDVLEFDINALFTLVP